MRQGPPLSAAEDSSETRPRNISRWKRLQHEAGHDQLPGEAGIPTAAGKGHYQHCTQIPAEIGDNRGQRAEIHSDIESKALIRLPDKGGHEYQMT
jgi:hypothetical protein